MPKMSIVVPVYYNAENLPPLYEDLKAKVLDAADFDIEVIFVDDGSGDNSYQVMRELARKDARIRIFHLSRNFGSDAATLVRPGQRNGRLRRGQGRGSAGTQRDAAGHVPQLAKRQ